MSGAGLPCSTSSPATLTANDSPARASVRSSRSRTDEEATATGTPRSRRSASASTASSNGTSRASISANSSRESSGHSAAASGIAARSARYACVRVYGMPTVASRSDVRDRVAVRRERAPPRLAGERLGVDEGPVAVENYRATSTHRPSAFERAMASAISACSWPSAKVG